VIDWEKIKRRIKRRKAVEAKTLDRERIRLPIYGRPRETPEAEGIRRPSCAHYDHCLSYAAENRWQGFTCEPCNQYAPKSLAALADENAGLLALVFVVENPQLGRKRPAVR
jgi:hypothetical protein